MTVTKNSVIGINCSNHTERDIVASYLHTRSIICPEPLNSPAKMVLHETAVLDFSTVPEAVKKRDDILKTEGGISWPQME